MEESRLLVATLPPAAPRESAAFPFAFMMLRPATGHDPWGRKSLKVAKIINITTIARPIRNPTIWARSDKGLPRTA